MKRSLLPVLLFILFLFEGTVMNLLIPSSWQSKVMVVPHFTFIAILFIGMFFSRPWAVAYGLCFGMLQDVVYYGPMLGPYSFTMGLVSYIVGIGSQRSKSNIVVSLLLIVLGYLLFEGITYGIYSVFQITHEELRTVFLYQFIPSLLLNLLFALLIYVPMRKFLEYIGSERSQDEEEVYH